MHPSKRALAVLTVAIVTLAGGAACSSFSAADDNGTSGGVATDAAPAGDASSGDASSGDASSGDAPASDASAVASRRIFVTSLKMYIGDFKSTGGADAACTSIAKAAGLGSTWAAVISEETIAAKDRLTIKGTIVNMKGETIATSAADLWDGTVAAAIRYDERGDPASGAVWSATNPDGTRAAGTACASWADQSNVPVLLGASTATDSKWIANTTGMCSDSFALYCLEQ